MSLLRPRPAPPPPAEKAGFYGKVPSRGDFVSSRFERSLRDRLDPWLQSGLVETGRAAPAGDSAWRFVLGPAVVGRQPLVGVMAASVDRVGRAFPLIVAAPVPGHRGSARLLAACDDWFEAAEAILRAVLAPPFDLAAFDAGVAALPVPVASDGPSDGARADRGRSYWWTAGGAVRYAATGLPAPPILAEMLEHIPSGSKRSGRQDYAQASESGAISCRPDDSIWSESALAGALRPPRAPHEANVEPTPSEAADAPHRPRPPLVLSAAAASHPGTRSHVNVDAATDGSRSDMHAVAAGAGRDAEAVAAARLAIDRLRRMPAGATIDDLVGESRTALGVAHARLRAAATAERPAAMASAMVLLASGNLWKVVFVGSVRLYLARDGLVRRINREPVEIGWQRPPSRALGAPSGLLLDTDGDVLRSGDRFLLCTRPLASALPERLLAEVLLEGSQAAAAAALVEEALVAGVADSVTALVAEAAPAVLSNGIR